MAKVRKAGPEVECRQHRREEQCSLIVHPLVPNCIEDREKPEFLAFLNYGFDLAKHKKSPEKPGSDW